jgi:hypothetical protein
MEEPPFALVFEANGIMLRLGMAKEMNLAKTFGVPQEAQ